MKIFATIICLVSLSFFTSCNKKTEVSGRVYSKYNVPVANAEIKMYTYFDSKYAEKISIMASTDEDGYYHFSFKSKRKRYYEISCRGDSDRVIGARVEVNKVNNIDLKFY